MTQSDDERQIQESLAAAQAPAMRIAARRRALAERLLAGIDGRIPRSEKVRSTRAVVARHRDRSNNFGFSIAGLQPGMAINDIVRCGLEFSGASHVAREFSNAFTLRESASTQPEGLSVAILHCRQDGDQGLSFIRNEIATKLPQIRQDAIREIPAIAARGFAAVQVAIKLDLTDDETLGPEATTLVRRGIEGQLAHLEEHSASIARAVSKAINSLTKDDPDEQLVHNDSRSLARRFFPVRQLIQPEGNAVIFASLSHQLSMAVETSVEKDRFLNEVIESTAAKRAEALSTARQRLADDPAFAAEVAEAFGPIPSVADKLVTYLNKMRATLEGDLTRAVDQVIGEQSGALSQLELS